MGAAMKMLRECSWPMVGPKEGHVEMLRADMMSGSLLLLAHLWYSAHQPANTARVGRYLLCWWQPFRWGCCEWQWEPGLCLVLSMQECMHAAHASLLQQQQQARHISPCACFEKHSIVSSVIRHRAIGTVHGLLYCDMACGSSLDVSLQVWGESEARTQIYVAITQHLVSGCACHSHLWCACSVCPLADKDCDVDIKSCCIA